MKTFSSFARIAVLGVFILALAGVPQLQGAGAPLAPGASIASVGGLDPLGGALLPPSPLVVPFADPVFSGTLTSTVLAGDPGNPFGGLTFTYKLTLNANSPQALSQLVVSPFDSLLTDVEYNVPGGGVAPSFFSRSNESPGVGQVIRFTFGLLPGFTTVAPGQSSALLVVQTSAQNFGLGTAGLIDGVTDNVEALVPSIVPEPGTVGLLVAGLGILVLALRRKN
jgi:hypothetical protein